MKENKGTDKKSERIRSYFIDAAKEIILRDGVLNVSVRKVAAIAGYSYATLYHYFADLEQLLKETKRVMVSDIVAYMQSAADPSLHGLQAIRRSNRQYALYYLENPHVFRFFYSCRPGGEPQPAEEYFDYAASWQESYRELVENGVVRAEDVAILARTLIYVLHGLLALYFSDNGMTRDALLNELDQVMDYLFKG